MFKTTNKEQYIFYGIIIKAKDYINIYIQAGNNFSAFFSIMNYYFRKDWIYFNSKWIYINITNPFKTLKKAKGVFKIPKMSCKICKTWNTGFWFSGIHTKWGLNICAKDVAWKDKYCTPRYEDTPPLIVFALFGLAIYFYWEWKEEAYPDNYWEQLLWYIHYSYKYNPENKDELNIQKAKEKWEWTDCSTNKSTWSDKYLVL